MIERWKKHPQWPVEVSSLGRVRAPWRGTKEVRVKKLSRRKCVTPHTVLYYNVCSVGGRGYPILRIGRLVLETFRGPAEGRECRHLDGNSINDRLRNLRWGTRAQQIADQKRHGTFSPPPVFWGPDNRFYVHGRASRA